MPHKPSDYNDMRRNPYMEADAFDQLRRLDAVYAARMILHESHGRDPLTNDVGLRYGIETVLEWAEAIEGYIADGLLPERTNEATA